MSTRPEFRDELVLACVRRYARPSREHPVFAQSRRGDRSFPTDYTWDDQETLVDHWNRVVRELDELRPRGLLPKRLRQSKQSVAADARVFAGPSDADAAELPHIDDAWCVAEFICAELGLRTDAWQPAARSRSSFGLRGVHVRYGLMLDWSTRDVAQRMARERDGSDSADAYEHYGLDAIRVALEHRAMPDELDELCARAGLRGRGSLWPTTAPEPRSSRYRHEWFDSSGDPGYREIAAIKARLANEELHGGP